jgi:Uma2 family endonuclease
MSYEIKRRRFTADEYQRMGQTGILSEDDRVELIDGEIVAMSPIGPRHNAAVNRANRALMMAVGSRAIVQVQGSVRLDLYYEPNPDVVLLQPRADDYASRLPGPGDILLLVEVADSSLEYDRDAKSEIYSVAGVQEYWLVDLKGGVVSCYSDPHAGTYRNIRHCRRGDSIAPQSLPDALVAIDDLLVQ